MANTIKQYKSTIFAGAGLFSVLFTVLVLAGIVSLPNFVSAANPETVNVTATISEWLSLALTTNTANLGELVSSAGVLTVGSATSGITASSNSSDGYSVTIIGTNGGLNGSNGGSIVTPATGVTTTCSTSTDGTNAYCAQATSATLAVSSPFNVSGNVVGSVASSSQKMLSSTYATTTKTATLTVKASANKYDQNGTYTDTLTLTAVATP